jgi:DNA-binding response OmpR family regulator
MANEIRIKPKILLVDDQESVQKLLDAILKVRNYDVVYASNGLDAIEIALSVKPDLVLLDVMMPGMDGFKVCQALKGNSATKEIPVVFLTARGDDSDREMGERVGASGFVKKPFRSAELLSIISSLLGG